MKVIKIGESGYHCALIGLSYNKKKSISSMAELALKLAPIDGGHNKFLEQIYVWLSVKAPRYWWQEADTYRLSSKQSESTMHTLIQELKVLEKSDYEAFIDYNFEDSTITSTQFDALIFAAGCNNLVLCKQLLPESYLQRRLWCLNYKMLRNIILQRKNHKLPIWQDFIKQVMGQISHPELLRSAL